MKAGNGSLTHATTGRPTIPSNRRRQPTVERGLFAGAAVPVFELEEELDKKDIAALKSRILHVNSGSLSNADKVNEDTLKIVEILTSAKTLSKAKPLRVDSNPEVRLPVISPVVSKEPKRFFAADEDDTLPEMRPVSPLSGEPLSPTSVRTTRRPGFFASLRSPRSRPPPVDPSLPSATTTAVTINPPKKVKMRSFLLSSSSAPNQKRTTTRFKSLFGPSSGTSKAVPPIRDTTEPIRREGEPLKVFRETAPLSTTSSTSTLFSSSLSQAPSSVQSPVLSKSSQSQTFSIDASVDLESKEEDDDRWWEEKEPRPKADTMEQQELLRCTSPTLAQSSLKHVEAVFEEETEEKEAEVDLMTTGSSASALGQTKEMETTQTTEAGKSSTTVDESTKMEGFSTYRKKETSSVEEKLSEIKLMDPSMKEQAPPSVSIAVPRAEVNTVKESEVPKLEIDTSSFVKTPVVTSPIASPKPRERKRSLIPTMTSPFAAFLSPASSASLSNVSSPVPSTAVSRTVKQTESSARATPVKDANPAEVVSTTAPRKVQMDEKSLENEKAEGNVSTVAKVKGGRVLALASAFDPAKKVSGELPPLVATSVSAEVKAPLLITPIAKPIVNKPPVANGPTQNSIVESTERKPPASVEQKQSKSFVFQPKAGESPLTAFIEAIAPQKSEPKPSSSAGSNAPPVEKGSKVKALRERFQPKAKEDPTKATIDSKQAEPELYSPLKAFLAMVEPQLIVEPPASAPKKSTKWSSKPSPSESKPSTLATFLTGSSKTSASTSPPTATVATTSVPPATSPLSAFIQTASNPPNSATAGTSTSGVASTNAPGNGSSPLRSFLDRQVSGEISTATSSAPVHKVSGISKPSPLKTFIATTSSDNQQNNAAGADVAIEQPKREPIQTNTTSGGQSEMQRFLSQSSVPSDPIEVHGELIRTQYVPKPKESPTESQETPRRGETESKPFSSRADRRREAASPSTNLMASKLAVVQSTARKQVLSRSSSSPSIRSTSPSQTPAKESNSPRTRLRKENSASSALSQSFESPRTRMRKSSSPAAIPSIIVGTKSNSEQHAGVSGHRAEGIKSVSLKDFSIAQTLQAYQKSTSGKLELEREDMGDIRHGRPGQIKSLSLKDVSLKESLSMYQSASSRSMVKSLKRESAERKKKELES